jgi:hypothetical protein
MRERVSRCDAMRWSIQIKHDTNASLSTFLVPHVDSENNRGTD